MGHPDVLSFDGSADLASANLQPEQSSPGVQYRRGALVEVRCRFDGRWSPGFVVDSIDDDGAVYVRRLSDGSVLPVPFVVAEIRSAVTRR